MSEEQKDFDQRFVDIDKLSPGPIRHANLTAAQTMVADFTFRAAGRFVVRTLEQWELGFMRDSNPDRELLFWTAIALTLLRYNVPSGPLEDAERESVVRGLLTISFGQHLDDRMLESRLRELMGALDGASPEDMIAELRAIYEPGEGGRSLNS